MEERLLKAPIFDLLFGTIGLMVGLSVAFLVSFGLGSIEIPFIIILSLPMSYLLFLVILASKLVLKSVKSLSMRCSLRKVAGPKKKEA